MARPRQAQSENEEEVPLDPGKCHNFAMRIALIPQGPSTLLVFAVLAFAGVAAGGQAAPPPPAPDPLHAWVAATDPASLETWVNLRLDAEKADLDKLLAVTGPRTVENTLRPFDDAQNELAIASNSALLLYALADSAPLRDKGQAMAAKVSSAGTDLSLNTKVYAALAAIAAPGDPATRQYLNHNLLEYRLSGVDKDDATRAKIRVLQDKITDLSLVLAAISPTERSK